MPSLSNIVRYFKSCYQVDFKAINIFNFFGKKVEDQLILESAELLSGKLMQYPVDSEWGAQMEQTLALHSQEKALYCCSFFLSGKMHVIGKPRKVFAPLYIHPANLIFEHDVYYISLDVEDAVINPLFVDFIKTQSPDSNLSYNDLEQALPKGYLQFDEIHQIETALKKLVPDLDISGLGQFPQLNSEADLKRVYKKRNRDTSFSLLPGIGIGLLQKPSGSRGILNELDAMAQQNDFAKNISDLFLQPSIKKGKYIKPFFISPVTLSENQIQVFDAYVNHRVSLVIGPPGTGKSFTIAALTANLISTGKSVLIASKNSQAGDVIAHKIENDFGLKGVVVKTNNTRFRSSLKKRLHNILHGFSSRSTDKKLLNIMAAEIKELNNQILKQEAAILKRGKEEIKWGAFFQKYKTGFFQKYKKGWIKFKLSFQWQLWHQIHQYEADIKKLQKKAKLFIRKDFNYHLFSTLVDHRQEIQAMLDALNSDTGNLMQAHFDKINFDVILHALPAWITNAADVHQALPLKKELFDVVIIDEATQCDIASSLPLLQRAKKVLIVGDPKQLRHISFLSGHQQREFAKKHKLSKISDAKLDYRKNSLLDLVSNAIPNQNQVQLLDEHYRSMPDIIDFSNQQFYNSQLKIMTATPTTLADKSVFLHLINGQRNTKGHNEEEADAIVKMIQTIIEKESELDKNICQNIGILSPFRAQVTYIKSKLRKVIDVKNMKRHRILVGTPHQFQGEERDIMMLSFAVDKDTHPSTFLYLNKPDVFNVSITRARSLQHIFTSVDLEKLKPKYLFTQLLQQANTPVKTNKALSKYEAMDEFLEDVVSNLTRWKVDQVFKSYPIAGIDIDIVIVQRGITYCIDLVGFPGDYEAIFPLERTKMLNRMNIQTFTLPYSSWYLDKTATRNALRRFIFPKGLKANR